MSGILAATVTYPSGYDSDAQAFFTAAGITDTTQKNAVNQLVLDLKAASIWTKMLAIYPFVGGTSTTHKYNLKDPRDLDAAFRMTFGGTVTHNANGITGNAIDGFGDSKLTPSTSLSTNDTHLSVYCRSAGATATNHIEIGAFSGSTSAYFIGTRLNDQFYVATYNNAGDVKTSNTDARGFFISSRRGSADMEAYKNGVSRGTSAASAGTLPSLPVYVLAASASGGLTNPTDYNIAFASIGTGLTGTNVSNFYTAVQAYQTTLGRQV